MTCLVVYVFTYILPPMVKSLAKDTLPLREASADTNNLLLSETSPLTVSPEVAEKIPTLKIPPLIVIYIII